MGVGLQSRQRLQDEIGHIGRLLAQLSEVLYDRVGVARHLATQLGQRFAGDDFRVLQPGQEFVIHRFMQITVEDGQRREPRVIAVLRGARDVTQSGHDGITIEADGDLSQSPSELRIVRVEFGDEDGQRGFAMTRDPYGAPVQLLRIVGLGQLVERGLKRPALHQAGQDF